MPVSKLDHKHYSRPADMPEARDAHAARNERESGDSEDSKHEDGSENEQESPIVREHTIREHEDGHYSTSNEDGEENHDHPDATSAIAEAKDHFGCYDDDEHDRMAEDADESEHAKADGKHSVIADLMEE